MLKQVEENGKANNEERNQAFVMLNVGMSVTAVSRHFGCTLKTIKRLRKRFRVA
jgi:transposase